MKVTDAAALKRIPLTPLRISNGALASDELPTRLKLLNWGKNDTTKGPVILDERSVAVFATNQRDLGFDRIAIDYEHNTAPGSPAYKEGKEPRPVAGYATPKLLSNDGLYLEDIAWTPSGKADAKNFADLSPAPRLDEEGRVLFLHSTALCRNGAVYDLSFFSADEADPALPKNEPTDMTPPAEIAQAITAALKPVSDQLVTLSAEIKAIKEAKLADPVITLMGADGKPAGTITLLDAGARLVKAEAEIAKFSTSAEDKEKAEVIARFSADGKVPLGEDGKALTDEALKTFSVGVLKMLLASTPATVPLSARGTRPADKQKRDDLVGVARAASAWSHMRDE